MVFIDGGFIDLVARLGPLFRFHLVEEGGEHLGERGGLPSRLSACTYWRMSSRRPTIQRIVLPGKRRWIS